MKTIPRDLSGSFFNRPVFYERLSVIAACVMAVSFSFSFALFNIGAVILFISFFSQRILHKNKSFFDPFLDRVILLYYFFSLLSLTQSHFLEMSLQGAHKLARYLLLFVVSRELIKDFKTVRWITLALLLGGAIASIDGVFQMMTGVSLLTGRTPALSMNALIRITGPFWNSNAFAIYLCFLIPLSFLMLEDRRFRVPFLFLTTSMIYCVTMTFSRPAALALSVAGGIIALYKKWFWLPVLGLLCLVAGYFLGPADIRFWLSDLKSIQSFFFDISRYYHHQAAWNMIRLHPILGVGLNTFDVNYSQYRLSQDVITRWSAHQSYLQIWAETGLLGLGSFLLLIYGIFRSSVRAFLKSFQLRESRRLVLGYMLGVISFLVIGFFESSFWQPRQTYYFWFFAGLLCGVAHQVSHEKA